MLNKSLFFIAYHLIVTVNWEEVFSQVEEGQDAADSPHIYSLSEGETKGNFRSPEEEDKGQG